MPGKSYSIKDDALTTTNLFSSGGYSKLLEIHPPQRRYKWGDRQVDQLWGDIVRAIVNDSESYFLGTILVAPLGNGNVSVIDGQQRIATITLLLASLRDYCRQYAAQSSRAFVIQNLISRLDSGGNPTGSLVVTLQPPDAGVFVKLVEQPDSTTLVPQKKGSDLLTRAVQRIQGHVRDYVLDKSRPGSPEGRLGEICKYIQENLKFLVLEVGDESEAYLVFDTTNTRGLRLSPSESLKGQLAAIAREDGILSQQLITKWNGAASKLENAGLPLDSMDDYLYAVYTSRHDDNITKRSLGRVMSRLNTVEKVREFVEEIDSCCDHYLAVVRPKQQSWLSEDLKDLNGLNIQSRPLLMMVHKLFPERFSEAVDLVLSLQIRNITVGSGQPHDYEKLWPRWARQVFGEQIDEAFSDIRARLVSDEEFKESFAQATTHSPVTARHLLRRLDPISHPDSGVLPVKVDVEHILPKGVVSKLLNGKKLTKNAGQWIIDLDFEIPESQAEKKSLGQLLQKSLNTLGNQALLNTGKNKSAKDSPFATKKGYYKEQALKLTNSLTDLEKWNIKSIEERQQEMAERAPQIWQK